MQRVLLVSAVVALGASSLACGSAAPVDFFDPSGPGAGAAGSIAAGGAAVGAASAGSSNSAGSAGAALAAAGSAGSSTSGPGDEPCSPAKEGTNMASGDFQTTGAVCLKVTDPVVGWGCSNFDGRTIKVNGVTVTCGQVPLPEREHGAYYFDISAGEFSYASFYWWSA
jgi:hypothetical protein